MATVATGLLTWLFKEEYSGSSGSESSLYRVLLKSVFDILLCKKICGKEQNKDVVIALVYRNLILNHTRQNVIWSTNIHRHSSGASLFN